MTIEIKVPGLPESVADATIAKWHKKPGDTVRRDENLVDIETDKVVLEVPAPADGVLQSISKAEGTTVLAHEVIGTLSEGAKQAESSKQTTAAKTLEVEAMAKVNGSITKKEEPAKAAANESLSPAVRRLVEQYNINVEQVPGSGKDGRITKTDVENFVSQKSGSNESASTAGTAAVGERHEKRVPMTRLRQRVAERLLSAQHTMAILTTFNEVDMHAVMELRKQYKDQFEKAHGVRLGFMSFFIKAVVQALQRFPDVNAFIDGNDIVYHNYCDIGVAVSSERGLVVPIIRNAEQMNMADIEAKIADYGNKARDNKITLDDMAGGTFTISNGGVFGSLLSTPILNPPQSAILGMHKIEDRAVVINGQIVVRPMMYLALSYDHRIIDGKDSVQFLKTIKELLEDPARILLEV